MLRRSLIVLLSLALATGVAHAKDRIESTPPTLKSVDVVEHPNVQVPADLSFVDENGKAVKLGDYLNQGHPVILTLNYLGCQMLCTLVLNGMVDCLKQLPLTAGKDYEIVTVSFNPLETKILAKLKKQNYVSYWGDGSAESGWHFLTGKDEQIKQLTNTVGFSYHYIPETGQYAHPAVIMVLTPDGRVSRYIYGVKFDEQTMRLSLVEAGKGKIGTPLDHILLYCYHYDASSGVYAPVAMNIMRLAGGFTVLALAIFIYLLWLNERRRRGGPPAISATPGVSNV